MLHVCTTQKPIIEFLRSVLNVIQYFIKLNENLVDIIDLVSAKIKIFKQKKIMKSDA